MPNPSTNKAFNKATRRAISVESTLGTDQKTTTEAFLKLFQNLKKPKQKSIALIVNCLASLNSGKNNSDEKTHNTLSESINKIIYEVIKNLNNIKEFKGTFESKKFIDSMKIMRNYEKILFSGLPYYRDHFFHQFWVYLIGVVMIELNYDDVCHKICHEIYKPQDIETLDQYMKLSPSIEAIWALTALFHDQAYLLEKIHIINENIYEQLMPYTVNTDRELVPSNKVNLLPMILCSERGEKHFNDVLQELSKYDRTTGQDNKLRQLLKKQLNTKNNTHSHAVLSALFMMHKLKEYAGGYEKDEESTISVFIHSIVTAIATHHLQNEALQYLIGGNRQLDNHFFQYLLRICDYAQEWNREDRKDKRNFGIRLENLMVSGNDLRIRINWREDFRKKMADEYYRMSKKYFNYSNVLKSKLILEIIYKGKTYTYQFPTDK